jgi:transitional endoplasmic reticulum ATPase
VPDKRGRLDILKIHTRNMPLGNDVKLKEIASVTHGFVGADLASLAKEAAMIVLRKVLPELQLEKDEAIPKETLEKLRILQKDFWDALKVVRPSAMREVLVEVPNVKWENIGGLDDVKQELIEAVEWPLKSPEAFTRMGVTPPRGILLYGAPGTGKTLLAKAVANESEANFILIKGPELLSKWVGESEKAVRKIFQKARQTSPSIIFFDEIDSLAPRRGLSSDTRVTERVVNQLLTEIDGLEELHNVVVIGATNRPDILDTALLRPGRFDRIILVGSPDEKTREKIFEIHTEGMPLTKDVDIKELAKKTEGYAGADIASLCREAAIVALRKDFKSKDVRNRDFEEALKKVRPSITKEIEDSYKILKEQFTKARAKEMKESKPTYFM